MLPLVNSPLSDYLNLLEKRHEIKLDRHIYIRAWAGKVLGPLFPRHKNKDQCLLICMYVLGHLKTLKVYLFLLVGSLLCCSFWLHDFASTGKITHEISAGNKRLHYSLCFQNQWLEIFITIREKSSNNLIQTKGTKILGWTTSLTCSGTTLSSFHNHWPLFKISWIRAAVLPIKTGSFKKHYYF